ncbi:hypothetical protein J5285_25280 (plasmid) [Agrobacterium larrymoorei]|uniref:Uncharacterized protein n=1 Tax=Agrobacterium larrymoorei TaxID=160699 RepID=A0ABX8THW3_9HYPH|nr:hypothetical protein J5285_25280 [Agrobacterium larrymoorei]
MATKQMSAQMIAAERKHMRSGDATGLQRLRERRLIAALTMSMGTMSSI